MDITYIQTLSNGENAYALSYFEVSFLWDDMRRNA